MAKTPAILQDVGAALYGERWQSDLGRAVEVTDRTVRRWLAGETEPDMEVLLPQLQDLVRKRADLLAKVQARLAKLS